MYFPYLRARAFELLAIRSLVPVLVKSKKILPLLEPVSADPTGLVKALTDTSNKGVKLAVITNPSVGAVKGHRDVLARKEFSRLLKLGSVVPILAIGTVTKDSDVAAFLSTHGSSQVGFLHLETPASKLPSLTAVNTSALHIHGVAIAKSHLGAMKGRRVSLRDGFNKLAKNALYPPDEFFSDDHLTFKSNGLYGFADYSIVGNHFSESGGAAHAVAIHLPHEESNGLWVRHFVSNRVTGTADTPGKFGEAVAKLASYSKQRPKVAATSACQQFIAFHTNGHFPGLGKVKQLSIEHHIETLAGIL